MKLDWSNIEDRYGERVVINDGVSHWPSNHGIVVQCAYFPPQTGKYSNSLKKYRVEVVGSGGNYAWLDGTQIETDIEYYRNEKLNNLGI